MKKKPAELFPFTALFAASGLQVTSYPGGVR